jgi:hypothetical protein
LPDKLQDTVVVVADTPGAPNVGLAPQAGNENRLRTDPKRQYVAAGGWQWYANYARTLPFAIDDITADFGPDLYERMYKHPHIAGLADGYRASILKDGLQLRPAVENKKDDGYDQAKKLVDEYNRVLENLNPSLDTFLWDWSSACYQGNRVAEVTYDDQILGAGPKLYAVKIQCKPRASVAFVVNTFNDVLGLLGRVPGVGQPVYIGTILVQPAETPNLIPRNKFAVLTWRPVDGNPLGYSMFRPLYDPWYRIVQVQAEELKFLSRFGSPGLIGETAPDADSGWDEDAEGNEELLALTPEEVLVAKLELWQNGAAIAIPNGASVQALWPVAGRVSPFQAAMDTIKHDMTYGFTTQTMATEEPKQGARSGQEVHENRYDTLVAHGKSYIERAFYWDVMRQMVLFNQGEKLLPLCPRVSLGVQQTRDAPEELMSLAAVYKSGYISESQKPGLDEKYNFPERDDAEDARIEAEKQQQEEAQKQQEFARQKELAATRQPPLLAAGQNGRQPQPAAPGQPAKTPVGAAK